MCIRESSHTHTHTHTEWMKQKTESSNFIYTNTHAYKHTYIHAYRPIHRQTFIHRLVRAKLQQAGVTHFSHRYINAHNRWMERAPTHTQTSLTQFSRTAPL